MGTLDTSAATAGGDNLLEPVRGFTTNQPFEPDKLRPARNGRPDRMIILISPHTKRLYNAYLQHVMPNGSVRVLLAYSSDYLPKNRHKVTLKPTRAGKIQVLPGWVD